MDKNQIEQHITRAPLAELLGEASALRQKTFQNEVELCSIVNIKSGCCPMDCAFCAQSVHHKTAAVQPLPETPALHDATQNAWAAGVHRVGWVASGCSPAPDELARVASAATSLPKRGGLCASLGQLPAPALAELRVAGFTRCHHNLETSERFYPSICTTQRWRDRVATLERARAAGLEICSGGIFGLGETWADRVSLAQTLARLRADSVPLNFLTPIPGTPLASRPPLSADEALRIIVLFRLLLPQTSLRVCGGRPAVFGARQGEIFAAGANALMTGDYLTTPGQTIARDLLLLKHHNLTPAKPKAKA